jgi:hypothetical protein
MGGAHALDGLWHRIGIDVAMKKLLKGRRLDPGAERVLFALVANRALAPSSTLAATRWVEHDSHIPGLPATSDDACYRAMDWLIEVEPQISRTVYDNVADLLNLPRWTCCSSIIRLIFGQASPWRHSRLFSWRARCGHGV